MERARWPIESAPPTGRRVGSSSKLTAALHVSATHRRVSSVADGYRGDLTGRRVGQMRWAIRWARVAQRGRSALICVSWAVSLHPLLSPV